MKDETLLQIAEFNYRLAKKDALTLPKIIVKNFEEIVDD